MVDVSAPSQTLWRSTLENNYYRIDCTYGYVVYRLAPGNTAEIVDIEVKAEKRDQGHGRWLVEEVKKSVGKVSTLYAITRRSNKIACVFYKKIGFKAIATMLHFYDGEGHHETTAIMYGIHL